MLKPLQGLPNHLSLPENLGGALVVLKPNYYSFLKSDYVIIRN